MRRFHRMFSSRTNWPLAPNRLAESIAARRKRRLPLLDLTESNPTHAGFEFATQELLATLGDPRSVRYEPDPRGLRIAREAVAAYYGEQGIVVHPQQIFLTTTTSEAYSYVFRLLADPGDQILVPRPSYPLFDFLARLDNVELTPYSLTYDHEWRIDFDQLESGLENSSAAAALTTQRRARAILVVHPNNPTGSFARRDEVERLVDLCRSHDAALIADEVFGDYSLVPREQAPRGESTRRTGSFASATEALTFTLSGLSKISALPQMKLAWIVVSGPETLREKALERLEVIADMYLSVSTPLAYALPHWLELRRSVQPQIMARLRRNLQFLDKQIAETGSSVSRLETEGGWYAILRVPRTRSDEDWAVELVQSDGVLVHPGHFYDFPSDGFLVVSLLTFPEVFETGVRSLVARVSQHS